MPKWHGPCTPTVGRMRLSFMRSDHSPAGIWSRFPIRLGKAVSMPICEGVAPNARAKRLKYGAAKFSAATAKPPSTVFSFMAFRVLGENMKAAKTSPPRRLIQLWI